MNMKVWWIGYRISTPDLISLLRTLPNNLKIVMAYHGLNKDSEVNFEDSQVLSEISPQAFAHEWRVFRRSMIGQDRTLTSRFPQIMCR